MAMRRCRCSTWFEYDARVKDEAVECPECGRILPRDAREAWTASRLGRTLVWLTALGALILAVGGLAGALALVKEGQGLPAALSLLGGILLGGVLVVLACTVRALGDAVGRLEDRVP
jgi:hypothetical protein